MKNHPPPPVDGQQNVDTPSTLKQVSVSLNKLNLASNATKKEKKPLDGSGTKSPSVQKRGRPKKLTPGQKKEKSLKRSLDKSMDKSVDKPTEKATEKATEDQQEPEAEPEPDFTRGESYATFLTNGHSCKIISCVPCCFKTKSPLNTGNRIVFHVPKLFFRGNGAGGFDQRQEY